MIIIPMAGASSRFTKAGYTVPKWMLPLGSRPLLDWSVLSFERYFGNENFLFVYLDMSGAGDFLHERVEALGIRKAHFVALEQLTRGQAETVSVGMSKVDVDDREPVTIFNIDTIRPKFSLERDAESDGWLECFNGDGDHWSFVKPDPQNPDRALQVTEKVRVSSYCCTGMYYFRTVDLFQNYYKKEVENPQSKELFVAPMYQRMIEDGLQVNFGTIDTNTIYFSGTPDEYNEALKVTSEIERSFGYK